MSFPKERQQRERGSGGLLAPSQKLFWRGCRWESFLAPASTFQRAASNAHAIDAANDMPNGPGVIEIAIANKKLPEKRIKVHIVAAESLRQLAQRLADDGGELRGFLEHACKNEHGVWFRYRTTKSLEDAHKFVDNTLDKFDYAWVQQPGARARSLVVSPIFCCCNSFRTGTRIEEGPPKFDVNKGGILNMLSGRKR